MQTQAIEEMLKNHKFFRDMKREDIATLAGCASTTTIPADEVIFRQQQETDFFYVVRSGKVAVDIHSGEENPLTIQTLGAGSILGWSWIFPPYLWQFDARAIEDTEVIKMDARCVRKKIDGDPRLGFDLMQRFSLIMLERLQATRLQLLDMYGPAKA